MPLFALVDCNNFFVSCERAFNPALINKPVAILSNNDGCVIARSNELKALGVPMGAPAFEWAALFKKHAVRVYSSNFTLYGDMSARVMQVLIQFAPEIEIYSIDEAFLELEGIKHAAIYAQLIRATVKQWTGIPVSIGIGPTKTLAKIANHLAKKQLQYHGVCDLSQHSNLDVILKTVPVADVWGVGFRYAKFLQKYGVMTAYDLKSAPDEWIRKNMTIMGLKTVWELRGISCLPLEDVVPEKKSITCSRSFGKPVTSLAELQEAVAEYVTVAAEKLRAQKLCASVMQVFVIAREPGQEKRNWYTSTIKLPIATSYTPHLLEHASRVAKDMFKKNYIYKKAGITLTGLVSKHEVQHSLFFVQSSDKQKKIMTVLDAVNQKWGRSTAFFAASGINRIWRARRARISPAYTTRWDQLPEVY